MPICPSDVVLLYDPQITNRDDKGHLNQRRVAVVGQITDLFIEIAEIKPVKQDCVNNRANR